MKRFALTLAAVALTAAAGVAQEQPSTVPPVAAAPVMIAGAGPVVESGPAMSSPARRGLFGRLRGRGATTMSAPAMPVTAAPGTMVAPAPRATMPTPMPMPMPGTGAMVTPTAPEGVVMVGGTTGATTVMPAGGVMPATGGVMPAGTVVLADGTMMMPGAAMPGTMMTTAGYREPMMSSGMSSPARRGLFGRLRNR